MRRPPVEDRRFQLLPWRAAVATAVHAAEGATVALRDPGVEARHQGVRVGLQQILGGRAPEAPREKRILSD